MAPRCRLLRPLPGPCSHGPVSISSVSRSLGQGPTRATRGRRAPSARCLLAPPHRFSTQQARLRPRTPLAMIYVSSCPSRPSDFLSLSHGEGERQVGVEFRGILSGEGADLDCCGLVIGAARNAKPASHELVTASAPHVCVSLPIHTHIHSLTHTYTCCSKHNVWVTYTLNHEP